MFETSRYNSELNSILSYMYVVHHMLFKHLDIKKDDTDNKNVDIKVSAHGACLE